MKQLSSFLLVFIALVLSFGCAQKSAAPVEEQENASYTRPGDESAIDAPEANSALPANPAGKDVVSKAKSAIGTPYVLGGSAPGGFDCSGLVKWSYSHVGVTLPRTAREQSVVGEKIRNVEDMRAGDIVAFKHPKRGYHTGIYVGDGKFVHSPRKRKTVRINSLSDPYFRETLLGARRVNMQAGENLVAQAQARLDEVIAEKIKLSVSSKNKRAIQNRKAQATASRHNKKNGKIAANNKKSQSLKDKNTVSMNKKGANLRQSAKKSASGKQAAKASSRAVSAKAKAAQAKNAKTRTTAAGVKKNNGKTVSMLNKKAQSRQAAKRKHS